MTKEEYIEKQKRLLEDDLNFTFNKPPAKIILKSSLRNGSKIIHHSCSRCKNDKFYMSHVKPKTTICSNCYGEDVISSTYHIIYLPYY